MPRYGKVQDRRYELMDEPAQVLEPGGTNGRATIKGLPVRSEVSASGLRKEGQATGVMAEPVAVLLRDAVTIDTAVRLTGADRATLQSAAAKGYLPSLKLGGTTSPYLVRLRDVMSYLARMSAFRQTRSGFRLGKDFLGFPDWLVERVTRAYPEALSVGTPYATAVVVPNRGGRPRIKPVAQAEEVPETVATKKPAATRRTTRRKRRAATKNVAAPKSEPKLSTQQRMRLPKWHPLWIRPGPQTTGSRQSTR